MVKKLPAVQETSVQSLGGEDPLEKGIAAYSSILAWRIPWTEGPGGTHSSIISLPHALPGMWFEGAFTGIGAP